MVDEPSAAASLHHCICHDTSHHCYVFSPNNTLFLIMCFNEVPKPPSRRAMGSLVNPFIGLYWAAGGVAGRGGGAAGLSPGSWSASDCLRAAVWIRHRVHCLRWPSWAEVCLQAPEIEGQLRPAMHTEGRAGRPGRAGPTDPHRNIAQ